MIDFGFNQVELSGGDNWIREPEMRKVMQGIKDIGGSRVRMAALWQILEPNRGQFSWSAMDRALNMCDEYGLKPLLLLQFPRPGWGGNQSDFGNFARAVAARYGSAGTGQVRDYEVMNEMNMVLNLSPPTASAYVPFLQAAYQGIKAVHPVGSTVITGGVMSCASSTFPFFKTNEDAYLFIKGIYDSGGKGYFDAIGYHWYSDDPGFRREAPSATQMFYLELLQVRDLMVAKGESAKKVWITEYGHGFPTTPTLTQCRDWLKIQTELLLQHAWVDKVFIYNYRNSGVDLGNINNQYGMVDFNFAKKQPMWDYVATLNPTNTDARFSGAGTLAMSVKTKASAQFVGTGMLFANAAARVSVTAPFTGSGSLAVEVFGRPAARFTGSGSLTLDAKQTFSRTAGFSGQGSLSCDVQTEIRRAAPLSGEASLSCQIGQQRFFTHDFSTGGKPNTFTDFGGLSYYTQFGLALNGNPGGDGIYFTGAVYNTDHLSNDQYSEVLLGNGQAGFDRSAMALVRCTPNGDRWVGAALFANFSQIFIKDASVIEVVAGGSAGGGNGDRIGIRAVGNKYTLYKNGVEQVSWNDDTGRISVSNKRTGFGYRHVRSGGPFGLYGTQGVKTWWGQDNAIVQTPLSAAAGFGGSATVSVASGPRLSAGFSTTGTLVAGAEPSGDRNAGMSGEGTLTTTAFGRMTVSATFSGVGAMSASTASSQIAIEMGGEGSLTAAINRRPYYVSYATGTTSSLGMSIGATSTDTVLFAVLNGTASTSGTSPSVNLTYGSYAMTRLTTYLNVDASAGIRFYVALYALRQPPSGAQNFAATQTGATLTLARLTGVLTANVGTGVTGVSAGFGGSGGQTSLTLAVPSQPTDLVLSAFVTGQTSGTLVGSGTLRYVDSSFASAPTRQYIQDQAAVSPTTTASVTTPGAVRWGAVAAAIPAITA